MCKIKFLRTFTTIVVCGLFSLVSFGQLTVSSNGRIYDAFGGSDFYVVMFNGIDSSTEIQYTDNGNSFAWYRYSGGAPTASETVSPAATRTVSTPVDDATGYYFETDGIRKISVWVIDYTNYLPIFNSFIVDENASDCEKTKLILSATITPLTYKTSDVAPLQTIERKFTITYNTLEWNDSWQQVEKTLQADESEYEFEISDPPLCNTAFTLTANDIYVMALGITPTTISTDIYSAVAVACKPTTITSIRNEKNEDQRPETADILKGSAPLDIFFKANPTDAVNHNSWSIYRNDELLITRSTEDHRYTFSEAGKYKVKLTSSNPSCSAVDSIFVDVSESALWVPNAFSPNGDGQNDEFRVAFRSLESFECWVYNRWGRLVYSSKDPLKGWDGTIGGRPAAAAPYFYVIKAVGTDGVKYNRKGDINLLR
jgi:hypothetical protein